MRPKKSIAVLLAAGLLAAGCTSAAKKKSATSSAPGSAAPSQGSSTDKAKYKQGGTVTISNEQGQTWTCQFNPFNPSVNLEAMGSSTSHSSSSTCCNNEAETPMLATSYKWNADQQGDRVHDPHRREVERRPALQRGRRGVHVQHDEAGSGHRPLRPVDGGRAAERHVASGNVVTLTFDKAAKPYFFNFANQVGDRPGAHLRHRRRRRPPGHLGGHEPGRHRAVQGRPVRAEQHPVHGQPNVLAARQALHPEGGVSGLPGQRPGQPRPRQRQGAVGQPVHPEHQRASTWRSRGTTTPGRRR